MGSIMMLIETIVCVREDRRHAAAADPRQDAAVLHTASLVWLVGPAGVLVFLLAGVVVLGLACVPQ